MKKRYITLAVLSPLLLLGMMVLTGFGIGGAITALDYVIKSYDEPVIDRDADPIDVVYSDLLGNPDDYEGKVVNYRGVVSGASNMTDSQYFRIVENPIFLGLPVGGIHGVGVTHYGEQGVMPGDVVTGYGVFTLEPVWDSPQIESIHLENHSVNATYEETYRINTGTKTP